MSAVADYSLPCFLDIDGQSRNVHSPADTYFCETYGSGVSGRVEAPPSGCHLLDQIFTSESVNPVTMKPLRVQGGSLGVNVHVIEQKHAVNSVGSANTRVFCFTQGLSMENPTQQMVRQNVPSPLTWTPQLSWQCLFKTSDGDGQKDQYRSKILGFLGDPAISARSQTDTVRGFRGCRCPSL